MDLEAQLEMRAGMWVEFNSSCRPLFADCNMTHFPPHGIANTWRRSVD